MTSGCLQNYFSDEVNEFGDNTSDGKSSEYKQIVWETPKWLPSPGNDHHNHQYHH